MIFSPPSRSGEFISFTLLALSEGEGSLEGPSCLV